MTSLRDYVQHKLKCELNYAESIAMEPGTYDPETTYPMRRRTEHDPPAVCTCGLSALLVEPRVHERAQEQTDQELEARGDGERRAAGPTGSIAAGNQTAAGDSQEQK